MKKLKVILLMAGVVVASFSHASRGYIWNSLGYQWLPDEGYWNVAANWEEGHIPTTTDAAVFDRGGTVRLPASTESAPFYDGSLFVPRVQNFPYGDKLTIDGRGAFWVKRGDPAESTASLYRCLVAFDGYFWGGEGLNAGQADDNWGWYATNLVLTVERGPSAAEDGATLTLKQGYLNTYDPLGHSSHQHNWILFNSSRPNVRVIYEPGTHTRTRQLEVRANGADDLFWIKGGYHEVYNNFLLKAQQNNIPANMRISGGTFAVKSGGVLIGGALAKPADGIFPKGTLTVDGTGELLYDGGGWFSAGGASGTTGTLLLTNDACAALGHISVGGAAGATGIVEVAGYSILSNLTANHVLYVGRETNSLGLVSFSEHAKGSFGQVRLGSEDANKRADATGTLRLRGESEVTILNGLYMGRASNSTGILDIADNAFLTVRDKDIVSGDVCAGSYARIEVTGNGGLEHGNINLCQHAAGTEADLIFGGYATNHVWQDNMGYRLIVGRSSNSVARAIFKDHANVALPTVFLGSDDNNSAKKTARGEMYVRDDAHVAVSNTLQMAKAEGGSALLDISGGTLEMPSQLQVGWAKDSSSTVRMTGGRLVTSAETLVGCAAACSNTVEVTGGELEIGKNIRIANADNSDASVHIGGTAEYTQTGDRIFVAYGNGSTGRLLIDGDADVTANLWAGNTASGTRDATIDLAGNATLHVNGGDNWIGLSNGRTRMTIGGSATLDLASNFRIGYKEGPESDVEVSLEDDARITGGSFTIGVAENYFKNAAPRLYFRGGHAEAPKVNVELGGTNSLFEISGGDHVLNHVFIYQSHGYETTTNTFRLSGGKISMGDWLVIGNNNLMGRVEITGGEMVEREVRLGFGNQNGLTSVMEVTGGLLRVENPSSPNADSFFYFGNGAGSRGHLVMRGGEIRTMSMKSGTDATGSPTAFFDGGTIAQNIRVHASSALIQDLDLAEVGTAGLTIAPRGFGSYINQDFTDAAGEGVTGTVRVVGIGSLEVRKESTHARTIVDGGTLVYGADVGTFGRTVELRNGGIVSLVGDKTTFSCERLDMSGGTLKLDAGDTITITGEDGVEISNGVLDVAGMSENGTYSVFTVADGASIDPAKLKGLRLKSADPFKSYAFDATGQLTIADRVFTDATWNGTTAAWSLAANWNPAEVPAAGSKAIFSATGVKSVTVDTPATTDVISFTTPGYTLGGDEVVTLDAAIENASGGKATVSAPLALPFVFALTGTDGSQTELAGAISAENGSAVTKIGSAKVAVTGDNADLDAAWCVSGGTLGFAGKAAFGTMGEPLELGAATLGYTGEVAAVSGTLKVAAATKRAAIVDVAGDSELSFTNVSYQTGRLVKKGRGTLTLDLPAGVYSLTDTSDAVTDNPGSNIVFPDSGDAPDDDNMFTSLSIVEGKMVIQGEGSNETKVTHYNGLAVGDAFAAAQTNAELELRGVYFDNFVDSYLSIAHRQLSSYCEPKLSVLDGSYLKANKLCIGWDSQTPTSVANFVIDGSTAFAQDHIVLGQGPGRADIRIRNGGRLIANNYYSGRYKSVIDVSGAGSVLGTENTLGAGDRFSWSGTFIYNNWDCQGVYTFRDGGRMQVASRIHGQNYGTGVNGNPGVQLVFDGGILDFLSSGTSIVAKPQYQPIITTGEGLTVNVAEGAVHALTFPIVGAAGLVKTGAGELTLPETRSLTSYKQSGTVFDFAYDVVDLPLGLYAGETEIREGLLTLGANMITNTARIVVDPAGTLDLGGNDFTFASVKGAGTVRNGSLATTLIFDTLGDESALTTFSNVSLHDVCVEFPETANPKTYYPVLKLAGVATADFSTWRGKRGGEKASIACTVDGEGVVRAAVSKTGLMIVIR